MISITIIWSLPKAEVKNYASWIKMERYLRIKYALQVMNDTVYQNQITILKEHSTLTNNLHLIVTYKLNTHSDPNPNVQCRTFEMQNVFIINTCVQ